MYIWNSFSSNIHTYLSNLDQVSKNSMFLKMTCFSHMIAYFNICRDFSVTQKKNCIVNASIYSLHCQCMKLRNSCRNYSESAGNFAFFSEKITPPAEIFTTIGSDGHDNFHLWNYQANVVEESCTKKDILRSGWLKGLTPPPHTPPYGQLFVIFLRVLPIDYDYMCSETIKITIPPYCLLLLCHKMVR